MGHDFSRFTFSRLCARNLLLAVVVAGVPSLRADFAPYLADSATLHLWHLNETNTPCIDLAPGGTNLTSLTNGASLGNPAPPGFGTALNTTDGGQNGTSPNQRDAGLSCLPLVDGTGDNVSTTFADPVTGAFTFEAVVRVDFNPSLDMGPGGTGRNSGMQIISAEGDDSEPVSGRLFQWRLDPVGVGSGDTSTPRFEFINLLSGAIQSVIIAIPTNGPDAIVSNQWYHAAVTYNGDENTTDNLKFYWTLMDTNRTVANLIGSGSLAADLPTGVSPDLVIGNEGRATFGSSDNWIGQIDEVRVSEVARAPNEFVFRNVSVLDASSWQDPNVPENTLDGDLGTRWSAEGDGQWITFDLGRSELVQAIDIAFYVGNTRTASFDMLLSDDNITWMTALTNAVSSGTTLDLEPFDLAGRQARYIRIVGHGNSQSDWNSLTEVAIQSTLLSDVDGDGLPDNWEDYYFTNSTAYSGADDPDSDTFNNLSEYVSGSNPTNALSTPSDTDADGLPDAWERAYFNSLAYGPGDDPDGDQFTNLQEYQGGSAPNDINSTPDGRQISPGPAFTQYIPINDDDPNTSEYAYAGSSAINAVAFIRSALITVSNQQFMTYYYRNATDSSDPNNNQIVVAWRDLDTNIWEIFHIPYTANNIADGHDVISAGIDGNGYMHISWGMHGNSFLYAKSTGPVTGNQPIAFGSPTTMTGDENNVTYPQFLTMPDGDLLFIFREGSSGAGDTFINRYDHLTQTWTNQQYSFGQKPFIKGTGWNPDYNCYPNMPCLDTNGNLFFIWVWRDTPAYESNHDFNFAKSTNGGRTWLRFDGTPYTLPISASGENGDSNTAAERILDIPQNSSLINQAGMCLDQSGQPVVATWWAPGTPTNDFRRQYMVLFRSTNSWEVRQVSQRTNDPPGAMFLDSYVRDLGRPVVVSDKEDRIIVLYRDNAGSNGLTIVHSLPKSVDPDRRVWTTFDLTTENLGNYEPVIDLARWQRDGVMDILYQPSAGLGYTPPANTASPIGVLEWNAAAYFRQQPALSLTLTNSSDAVLSFVALPSWGYRLLSSTNLTDWESVGTWNNLDATIHFNNAAALDEERFWKLEYQEGAIPAP